MKPQTGMQILMVLFLFYCIGGTFTGCETDDDPTADWLQEKIDYFEGQPPKKFCETPLRPVSLHRDERVDPTQLIGQE